MVNPERVFHTEDYCIFAVTVAIALGIGVFFARYGGKQRTTAEYFLGNRRMACIPVGISLMVSFQSAVSLLGFPAEVYVYGLQVIMGSIGAFFAKLVAITIILPLIYSLNITTTYEYLGMRFDSHSVRLLGTVLGMIKFIIYMGMVLYGPAIGLEAVTGVPIWISILSISVISVIYTSIGGFKTVVWTDVFQFTIMFAGLCATLIKGSLRVGGFNRAWDIAKEKGRINLFNFDPDPTVRHTFWNLCVGSLVDVLANIFDQTTVQRISSMPSIAAAKRMLIMVTAGFLIGSTCYYLEGVVAYAYFDHIGCDPLKSKQIKNLNQIIPHMVMDIFHETKGMPGLFLAALASASLSSLSSGLNGLSAQFWTDILKPHLKPVTQSRAVLICKLSVVLFAGLSMFAAFMISLVGGPLIQILVSIRSAFGGPVEGLFLFAAFCPWGNAKGAFWGTILSSVMTFIICIGQMLIKGAKGNTKLPSAPIDSCPVANISDLLSNITTTTLSEMTTHTLLSNSAVIATTHDVVATGVFSEPTGFLRLFMVSYQWFGSIATLQVILYGTIISLCTGHNKPGTVNKKYIVSFFDSLLPCLPECILKPLRFGYTYEARKKDDDAPDRCNDLDEVAVVLNVYDLELKSKETGSIDAYEKNGPNDSNTDGLNDIKPVAGETYQDSKVQDSSNNTDVKIQDRENSKC